MGVLIDMVEAIRSGTRSATECVRQSLDRIESMNDRVGAFISVNADRALDQARRIDESRSRGQPAGALTGVPIAVKDNLCTSYGRTTCASNALADFRAGYDATVIQRLEQAGAIVVGKTNLDEFAMGSSTEHSALFPARNPWDLDCVPGGSSGGSAAAVASGMAPAALGSDTGGSIRLPASFCGVVGLKPTYGRVSRYGLVAFASSLDQIGPIAQDARDAALLLGVMAGHDPLDTTCANETVPDYLPALDRRIDPVRIGVCEEYFSDGLDEATRQAVHTALHVLEQSGATLVPVRLPHMDYAVACYYLIATAEASSNLARFDGIHYGHRSAEARSILDVYTASRGEGFGAEVKRRIMLGTYALSSGYQDRYYVNASKVRTLIKRDFETAFEQVDVIASPVAPHTAFRLGEKSSDPLAMYLEDIYTISANLAGICAISLPCGLDGWGLPIGLQLMGPAFGEERLLSIAHHYQCLTDHHTKAPGSAPTP